MLDKKDLKILWELDNNARISLSELAKKIGISKQNLNYRIKKLIQKDYLLGFTTLINFHKLGYIGYRIYFRYRNITEEREKEFINYLKNHNNIVWFVSTSGSWDIEVLFIAENPIQFNNIFKKIKEDYGQYFSKYNVSTSIVNYHFNRDYLINKKRGLFSPKYYGFEPKKEELDELDIKILSEIANNCRQSNQEIGRKFKITYHTVKERIKKLENKKIIQKYIAEINLNKININYCKAILYLNNPSKEEEKKLYSFCSQYNFVTYLVEVLGEWQFEIEAEIESQDQLIALLRKIRNEFPNLITDYDILQVTKRHKLNYFPIKQFIKS
ncbi:Lrp/AsnC family transcriptional regulator [Candidatus Woesearchaeota archaeon]|nr:Lrp/AsnC family transcriptional regulator [Candidatus Woesearchaeota archaeon]